MIDNADAFGGSVESTLSFADEPVTVLRDRLLLAMRYTFSWQKAIGDALASPTFVALSGASGETLSLAARVDAMQTAIKSLFDAMPPDMVFPGNDAKDAYEETSRAFAQLYRDLALSLATLPQRSLLDQAGDLGSALFQAPAAAVKTLAEQIAQMLRDGIGGAGAALWAKLWPFFLVAGAGGLVYVFRAPLLRVVGKVAA